MDVAYCPRCDAVSAVRNGRVVCHVPDDEVDDEVVRILRRHDVHVTPAYVRDLRERLRVKDSAPNAWGTYELAAYIRQRPPDAVTNLGLLGSDDA